MKVAFSILATAALAAAQSNPLNSIPDCAKGCIGQFMTGSSIAGCSLVDYKCVCSNKDFISQIACCLAPVCDDAGKQATLDLAGKLCKAYGVDLPTVVACSTGSSSSSAASSSNSSSGSSSAASSGTASAQSTTAGSNSTTSAGSSSGATTGTSTGSKTTGAASSSATSTSKPGAAPTNVAGIAGALAALAFAL